MIVQTIAIPVTDPYLTLEVALEGSSYSLDISWNYRAGLWYMSLYLPRATGDREPIIEGQAMVTARPLLAGITHPERPPGELIIVGNRDAGRYSWGTETQLRYYPVAALEEILG